MSKVDYLAFSLFSVLALTVIFLGQGCAAPSGIAKERAHTVLALEEKSTNLDTARQAFLNGQRPLALQKVEQGLLKSGNDENLLLLKADIESYDCQFEKAIANYTKAIARAGSPKAYAARGEAYLHLGKYTQAREDIQRAFASPKGTDYQELLLELNNLEYDSQHSLKDPAKLWAIACTSSLYTNRSCGNNTLAGAIPNDDLADGQRKTLSKYWGIDSRDQLLVMLKRLMKNFDNERWQQMRKQANSVAALSQYRQGWVSSEDYNYALKLLREHGDEYGDRGLQAWDYCRYMNICRGGYQAKYISEDEAWALMMPMAARIQTLAKSWAQLESEYLVGFSFWSHSAFARKEWHYMRNVHRLLKDPTSPWVKLDWNTRLNCKSDDASIYAAIDKVAHTSKGI